MIDVTEEALTIQQVAERTGVSAHTLRYYEKIGLLNPVGRHENGHRRYVEQDLDWIHFLKLLRRTGMSIQHMQQFIELARAGDHTIPDRVEVLTQHRRQLSHHIAELQEHMVYLDYKIGHYNDILDDTPPQPCE